MGQYPIKALRGLGMGHTEGDALRKETLKKYDNRKKGNILLES